MLSLLQNNSQRMNEPIFWVLFGAGGMWSAIFLPAVILIICFLIPLGIIDENTAREKLLLLCQSFFGKIFIFSTIILPLWSSMHRIYHCLKDFKVPCLAARTLSYSFAGVVTIITLLLVLSV